MPSFISKDLIVTDYPTIITDVIPDHIKTIPDTEYTQKLKMIVDLIGVYFPALSENVICYNYKELNDDFHPILTPLTDLGFSVIPQDEELLQESLTAPQNTFDELIADITGKREVKKAFKQFLKEGYFDHFLDSLNLPREALRVDYLEDADYWQLSIAPRKLAITMEFFFQQADLFKIWGRNNQHLVLHALLNQTRVIKATRKIGQFVEVQGELRELQIQFSDCYHRIPPLSDKSLDGNAKALGIKSLKIDIKTEKYRDLMGVQSVDEIMENFSTLYAVAPIDAMLYNAQDIFQTDRVSTAQQQLLDHLRSDFNLESRPIADTTGSNVSKFIVDLVNDEFDVTDKEQEKLVKELLKLSQLRNLQNVDLNDFGVQPFLTVGGLLFTRSSKHPVVTGNMADCDESSCYATVMSELCVYIGEPVIRTFKYKKYKPTLREILSFVKDNDIPRDVWCCRVSGTLQTAINTLVLSDLRFEPKKILCPTVNDLNPNRKSIEQFNAYKTPKKQAVSTLLTKEIKFGLVTQDIVESLSRLPENWCEEYLNLAVDAFIYFPSELIAESLNDVEVLRASLPDEPYLENFDPKSGMKNIQTQYYKNNVCLKFDIGKYWRLLREKRQGYKDKKNPVQEVYKLFGNSGYGVMACIHLATNNLLASNIITGAARAGTWLMINSLNGLGAITDGTNFCWDNIPIGRTFREILEKNPNYVLDFDPTIKSGLDKTQMTQKWFKGTEFKQFMREFYEVDETCVPLNRFDFELKEEVFKIISTSKWLKHKIQRELCLMDERLLPYFMLLSLVTTDYQTYHNTNAGNYTKGYEDSYIIFEGSDYNFLEQNTTLKARSFQGKDSNLIEWYTKSLSDGYDSPMIYEESELIKFADGCQMAIKALETYDEVALPTGFNSKKYKAMKLISRSQFLFQTEQQLKNFETNEQKLAELSKELLSKAFWQKLTNKDLEPYDVQLIPDFDYYEFAKTHSVGIGFELLALTRTHKNSIESVRTEIFNKIQSGCKDFNAGLHISRNYKLANKFKYILAAIIVKKGNQHQKIIETMVNSIGEPTIFTVRKENVRTLQEIKDGVDGIDRE